MPARRIESAVMVWFAGDDDDPGVLLEDLLGNFGIFDIEAPGAAQVHAAAVTAIDDAIELAPPSALDLRRALNWCKSAQTLTSFDKLITVYWPGLTDDQKAVVRKSMEALDGNSRDALLSAIPPA